MKTEELRKAILAEHLKNMSPENRIHAIEEMAKQNPPLGPWLNDFRNIKQLEDEELIEKSNRRVAAWSKLLESRKAGF